MPLCPLCHVASAPSSRSGPYHVCPSCDLWFQDPLPPKVYEASHEKPGDQMGDAEKAANRHLAHLLFARVKPKRALDVGSKFPFLSACLRDQGVDAMAIDGIAAAPEFGNALGVPTMRLDLEASEGLEHLFLHWRKGIVDQRLEPSSFDLVTLVHCFEHLYEPVAALRLLRSLVSKDGRVFLRMPDHEVAGYERDMTPGHYTIHPYFHTLSSVLEALSAAGYAFVIEETSVLEPGQRDYWLRPIERRPTLAVGMIAKNEEKDVPRCVRSLAGVADSVVLVDTGSTDDTITVAAKTCDEIRAQFTFATYLGASEPSGTGDIELWDFAKARNEFLRLIEEGRVKSFADLPSENDWVLWVDADDELVNPRAFRRMVYGPWSVVDAQVSHHADRSGQWPHCRMWRTGMGVRFEGACHEIPVLPVGAPRADVLHGWVRHHQTVVQGQEPGLERNYRILKRAWDRGDRTPRAAFYLGCTCQGLAGRGAEAAAFFQERVRTGVGFRDEWALACVYAGRNLRKLVRLDEAWRVLCAGVAEAPEWAELWMELAWVTYARKEWRRALGLALQAHDRPLVKTALWPEPNMYTDQPPRLVSWCHEHLGETAEALRWAEIARERIGKPDAEWEERVARLRHALAGQPVSLSADQPEPTSRQADQPEPTSRQADQPRAAAKRRLALLRPGAIGDVIMTLNLVPLLRRRYPDHEVHYFTRCSYGLEGLMDAAGVDQIRDADHVEGPGQFDVVVNLIGYPLHEGYPEQPMRQHLLRYFAAEMGLGELAGLPALVAPRPANFLEGQLDYATLQVRTGWSRYKEWPVERWAEVVRRLPDVPFLQIGREDEPRVPGALHLMLGQSLDKAVAAVANARLHVGLDSFASHLTHVRWQDATGELRRTPGVILWGSTQESASGYPTNANLSARLPCQPCFREDPAISRMSRGPCDNPPGQTYAEPRHACMSEITVDQVVEAVREAWRGGARRHLELASSPLSAGS